MHAQVRLVLTSVPFGGHNVIYSFLIQRLCLVKELEQVFQDFHQISVLFSAEGLVLNQTQIQFRHNFEQNLASFFCVCVCVVESCSVVSGDLTFDISLDFGIPADVR